MEVPDHCHWGTGEVGGGGGGGGGVLSMEWVINPTQNCNFAQQWPVQSVQGPPQWSMGMVWVLLGGCASVHRYLVPRSSGL